VENVKYQVFISSTFSDLIEERKKILDVLLMADCIPAGMEAFVATDIDQFEVIKKVIDICDYYILIIGKRYGSVNPKTGISYTEMEYDYAIENEIPVLVFAIDESIELSPEKIEQDLEKKLKLNAFRNKAMTNRLVSIWKTHDDLTGKIAVSIMKAKEENKRLGWMRGQEYQYSELLEQINTLRITNDKLKNENAKLSAQLTPEEISIPNLAEGEDIFTIRYSWRYNSYDCSSWHDLELKKTWNELFSMLGSCFRNGCTYTQYEKYAVAAIQQDIGYGQYRLVNTNDIKRITYQFEAQGLIKSIDKNSDNGSESKYVLTKKGLEYLPIAATIKKENSVNSTSIKRISLFKQLFKR